MQNLAKPAYLAAAASLPRLSVLHWQAALAYFEGKKQDGLGRQSWQVTIFGAGVFG